MTIYVSQIYPEAGVSYPFSHEFQKHLGGLINAEVGMSQRFTEQYGPDYDLIFRVSAKSGLVAPEIKGPTVFKRDKDVEYTVFLPFDRAADLETSTLSRVLEMLLASVISILNGLGMSTMSLVNNSRAIVSQILSDNKMIDSA
ncbi:MAG: hypothetical protein ACK493_13815 [Planctomycetota bacterium]|jgi:hypothetical protein